MRTHRHPSPTRFVPALAAATAVAASGALGCAVAPAGAERTGETSQDLYRYVVETVAVDTTFGATGLATAAPQGGFTSTGNSAAVLPDGSVLVAGTTGGTSAGSCFDLVHFLPSGTLDPAFGVGGGHAQAAACSVNTEGLAVAVQRDGKVLVAGHYVNTALNEHVYGVGRYVNGVLDTSWGNYGLATAASPVANSWGTSIAIESDGKVLVGGTGGIARFTTAGWLDTSFGNAGFSAATTPGIETFALTLQADGKIVGVGRTCAAGVLSQCSWKMMAERFTPAGQVDTSFGSQGVVAVAFGGLAESIWGTGVYVQPSDGSILLAGTDTYIDRATGDDMASAVVVKLTPAGAFDATYAGSGKQQLSLGSPLSYAVGIGEAPDGSIVVAGYQEDEGHDYHAAIADVSGTGSPDLYWGSSGVLVPSYAAAPGGLLARGALVQGNTVLVVGTVAAGYPELAAARFTTTLD